MTRAETLVRTLEKLNRKERYLVVRHAILNDRLEIRFNAWERMWSAHPGDLMSIPLRILKVYF